MRGRTKLLCVLLAAAGIAGCLSTTEPSVRTIDGAFPPLEDLPELPFRIADRTGLVQAVSVVNLGNFEEGIRPVPGRDDALSVLWTGGMCDRRVLMEFERRADGLTLNVSTERGFGGCRLAGVLRNLLIEFTQPVDASTVSFSTRD
jgi:hypothetical protein